MPVEYDKVEYDIKVHLQNATGFFDRRGNWILIEDIVKMNIFPVSYLEFLVQADRIGVMTEGDKVHIETDVLKRHIDHVKSRNQLLYGSEYGNWLAELGYRPEDV